MLYRSFAQVQRIDTCMLEYNYTARRRHSLEWIQSRLRERVSFPTCRISLSFTRFVTRSSCTNEHRPLCTRALSITRRIFLVCVISAAIFAAWSRYWLWEKLHVQETILLMTASSLIKFNIEYWTLNRQFFKLNFRFFLVFLQIP